MIDIADIDWNEAWTNPGPDRKRDDEFVTCLDRWSDTGRCRKFNHMAKAENWKKSWARIRAMNVTPATEVLDIGAGPGTLAVPLSSIVRHVTAVEPSEGMIGCLNENIREAGIQNIAIVPKKWEDVDPAADLGHRFDIVVASYSLGVPDLRDALEKMNEVTERYAYIFWFADMQSPWRRKYGEIWEQLFGVPHRDVRRPNVIFNLLNQIGIYANIEVSKGKHASRFSSIDEAVADQYEGLKLKTREQEAVLRNFLEQRLRFEDGSYVLDGTTYEAKIWWEKER